MPELALAFRFHTPTNADVRSEEAPDDGRLPNQLLTAFDVAKFVGCHEETVRCAYLRGRLVSYRFGFRGRRFQSDDALDWIRRWRMHLNDFALTRGAKEPITIKQNGRETPCNDALLALEARHT